MTTLFISDLHLDESRPHTIALALDLLNSLGSEYTALYILGDFVEYWIGDDYCQPALRPVFDALAALGSRNTTIRLMHGNRDFLISSAYAARYKIELISDDEFCIDLYGVPTLLVHGDSLCVDDVNYQNFRAQVRKPAWQAEFLKKSVRERLEIVAGLRDSSQKAILVKTSTIMDVNQNAVESAMRKYDVARLIHGHTHRPAKHQFELNNAPATRFVLGEWKNTAQILVCTPTRCTLVDWPEVRI